MKSTTKHNNAARRRLLKTLTAVGGAVAASKLMPPQWTRPVVAAVMLPAHAQSTCGCGITDAYAILEGFGEPGGAGSERFHVDFTATLNCYVPGRVQCDFTFPADELGPGTTATTPFPPTVEPGYVIDLGPPRVCTVATNSSMFFSATDNQSVTVNFRDQNGVICYAVAPIEFITTL